MRRGHWARLSWGLLVCACVAPAASDGVRADLDSAFVDLIRGETYLAMQRYQQVLAADSTSALAHRYLGWIQITLGRGDLRDAGGHLRRAVALNPDDAGAHNDLGYVYAFQHNFGLALMEFETAARLRPDGALFHRNVGMAAIRGGDFARAEGALRRATAIDSLDGLALYGLGLALARQGRDREALDVYRRSVAVTPDAKLPYVGMGQVLARQGLLKEAAAVYERAARTDPYDPQPHFLLAGVYRQLGDARRADREMAGFRRLDAEFRDVVRDRTVFPVQPDRLAVLRDRGAVLAGLGRHEEALALYGAGLALADSAGSPYRFSPEVPALRLSQGLSHRALGEVEAARGAFERVLRDYPNAPEAGVARQGLADLYLVTEGVPAAEAQGYERAVAMDPTSMAAFGIYDRLCAEQRRLGLLDRAVAAYEAQRDLAPGSVAIRVKLGVAWAAAGRIDEAARVYQEAISMAEHPSDLYRQLAVIYDRAGRRAEAEAAAAKAEGR